jgi:hypothetical protein
MSSKAKTDSKGSPDEAVKAAVESTPGATIEGIAQVAGIGRSTAGKVLGRLADAGKVTRHQGGRERGRRLPDRFTLTGVEMPPAWAGHVLPADEPAAATDGGESGKAPASDKPAGGSGEPAAASEPQGGKLKPGGLDPLVLGFLEANKDSGPHGATQVAKALQRSSGAVGNCLERLREAKKVKLAEEKPRRYSIA